MAYRNVILLLLILISLNTFSAACCGGGSGSSALIFSDHRAKLTTSYDNTAYVYYVDAEGNTEKRDKNSQEVLEKFSLSYSYLTDNFFQFSVNSNISKVTKRNNLSEESSSNLGDTTLGMAYEFFPEKYYSVWKPRGFIYLNIKMPTGNSKHEIGTEGINSTDTSGIGLYSPSLGIAWFKVYKSFDFTVDTFLQGYFDRRFDSRKVERGFSYFSSFSFGYSPNSRNLRFGSTISYKKDGESKIEKSNGRIEKDSVVKLWTLSISSSYMINDRNSFGVTYRDQTVFSESRNTDLERAFVLSYNRLFLF